MCVCVYVCVCLCVYVCVCVCVKYTGHMYRNMSAKGSEVVSALENQEVIFSRVQSKKC